MPVMKGLVRSAIVFSLLALTGLAQIPNWVAAIYLSVSEAAKAKQISQELKSARDRQFRAATAFADFYKSYESAHLELSPTPLLSRRGWMFSPDFRVAFSVKSSTAQFPIDRDAEVVELSTEERQKAESLSREMEEAGRAVDQARKNYFEYSYELVADRFPNYEGGLVVELSSGRKVTIPQIWFNGVNVTPDFRIAVVGGGITPIIEGWPVYLGSPPPF